MILLSRKEYHRENYPHVKGITNIFMRFPAAKYLSIIWKDCCIHAKYENTISQGWKVMVKVKLK